MIDCFIICSFTKSWTVIMRYENFLEKLETQTYLHIHISVNQQKIIE